MTKMFDSFSIFDELLLKKGDQKEDLQSNNRGQRRNGNGVNVNCIRLHPSNVITP